MTHSRPTDEIEPLVPTMPRPYAPDGGRDDEETPRETDDGPAEGPFDRPPRRDHAPADRHREAIEPLVPDLR